MEGNSLWQEPMKCNFLSHHEDVVSLDHKYANNSNFKVKHYFTYDRRRRRKQTRSQGNICSFVEAYQHLGKAFNRVCLQVKANVKDCPNVVDSEFMVKKGHWTQWLSIVIIGCTRIIILWSIAQVNQWRNSEAVINWFKNIQEKHNHIFLSFDIVDFYPSITEDLLNKSISWASNQITITDQKIKIINHARKSLLFDEGKPCVKKQTNGTFDVTMGSYDGGDVCELVGLFMFDKLEERFGKENIGQYRDNGLATLKKVTCRQADRSRKIMHEIFNSLGLKITAQTNQNVTNFVDITLA